MGNSHRSLVGINLVTAGHLADALVRAAQELEDRAVEGYAAARSVGVAAVPAARLSVVGDWAREEARHLHDLLGQLRRLDGGPVRWAGGTDPDFADPVEGVRLGQAIVAALDGGDLAAARRLLAAHADDPVVATVVLEELGVDHLLQALRVGSAGWAHGERDVALGLGEVLATAARHGTTTLRLGELAERADEVDLPRSALALLFAGGARYPTAFLRAAVVEIVAPVNALLRRQPGLGVGPWMIEAPDAPLDARVVVLDAAAGDRRAAREAVGSVDLDDLLEGDLAYLDGGVALARVLLAATTPADRFDGLAAVNAQRVIEWVGRHQHVPLAVHAELGHLATPWIDSFRSSGLDGEVPRRLPLDEQAARGYLTYAQARDLAAEDLERAAWRWATVELDRLASHGRVAGFDAVGSVLGMLTVTGLDARAAEAADEDRAIARQNVVWRRVTQLVIGRLSSPARLVVSPLATRALARVLPVPDRELRHWREGRDPAVLHEHLALDYLAASTLWRHRADHAVPDPPSQLLVDPSHPERGLRNPITLSAADADRWRRWRSVMAADGQASLQLAGDAFFAESRES
jgi:hypothetical protein